MAKKVLRQKLMKLLLRAESDGSELYQKVLWGLGYTDLAFPISSEDLEVLLESASNMVAEDAVYHLSPFQGPTRTISPKYIELSEYWRKRLNTVAAEADTMLLTRARDLTQAERAHLLVPGGDFEFEDSRYGLYVDLISVSETEYNSEVGRITGIARHEYQELIAPELDLARRRVVLNMFIECCPDENDVQVIRKRIRRHLFGSVDFVEAMMDLQRYINTLFWDTRVKYLREFLVLMTLLAAGRRDYERMRLMVEAKRELDFNVSVFENLRESLMTA